MPETLHIGNDPAALQLLDYPVSGLDRPLATPFLLDEGVHVQLPRVRSPDAQTRVWGITQPQVDQITESPEPGRFLTCVSNPTHLTAVCCTWTIVLGWSEEELLQTPYIEFIHPEDRVRTTKLTDKFYVDAPYARFGFENRWRHKDGSYRWFQWAALPTTRQHGEDMTALSVAKEVTAEKEALRRIEVLSAELHRKNRILHALHEINSTYIGVEEVALTTGVPIHRLQDCDTFRVAVDNLLKLTNSEFGLVQEARDHPCSVDFTRLSFISPEAEDRFRSNLAAKSNCGVYGRFAQELGHAPSPIIINDPAQHPMVSPSGPHDEHNFLLPATSLVGIPLRYEVHQTRPPPRLIGYIVLGNRTGGYDHALLQYLEPVTHKISRIVNEVKLLRANAESENRLAEQKEKEVKLQQDACRKAEASSHAKSAFVAHMSHELRTPLNAIVGYLDLASQDKLPPAAQEHITHAKSAAEMLATLTNDILDLSRIEANQLVMERRPLDLYEVVDQVMIMLRAEAVKKGLNFQATVRSSVPKTVLGDELRVKQILLNLLRNAIKFTSEGHVSLVLDGAPRGSSDFVLRGCVQDTGIGIAPEALDRLFQPFSQVDDSLLRQFGGAGLGLYITKELCERMGGQITVVSTPDVGSSFHFIVTLKLNTSATSSALGPAASGRASPPVLRLPPLRILIAEDNVVNQKLLTVLLRRLGCKVVLAQNGQEAVDAVERQQFDAILMDGEMPVMDGLEATRRIRATNRGNRVPIIGVTAHAMEGCKDLFLGAGMNAYLSKPVNRNLLTAELHRLCVKNSAGASA